VLVGRGPAGVVLLHQHPADLCGFWPYAVYLSKRGLQTQLQQTTALLGA
jgi:hypothetical protein